MRLRRVAARPFFLLLVTAVCSWAQTPSIPHIGIIDYFGVRKASPEQLGKALGVKPGDPLPKSKAAVEERLEFLDEVVRARLEAVCCSGGKAILFVGIEEKGAPAFVFREAPEGEVELPEEIVALHQEFLEKVQAAVIAGEAGEDIRQGHSLMVNAAARAVQMKFLATAKASEDVLRKVLRESANEVHRAVAATVIAYAPRKLDIVDDLQFAMQDPDDGVRNNAMRSLVALAALAESDEELGIRVSPTWFVEMMNSIVWTDRNKASNALVFLTEKRNERTLALLRERALQPIAEMARWKSIGHAFPGFVLLGRIAGIEESRLQDIWKSGDYLPSVDQWEKKLSKTPAAN